MTGMELENTKRMEVVGVDLYHILTIIKLSEFVQKSYLNNS